jgi:hypothetical protein
MSRSLKSVLNDPNPNQLADLLRATKVGTLLNNGLVQVRVPVASDLTSLPEQLRAAQVIFAYATAGTTAGVKAVQAFGATPTTGQCAVNLNGQVVFAAADAVTEVELIIAPYSGDLIEEVVFLNASGVGTLQGGKTAKLLLSGTVTSGSSAGLKTNIARAGTPSAAQVCLSAAGNTVLFNVAAANSTALIRYIASAGVDESASELLVADQNTF